MCSCGYLALSNGKGEVGVQKLEEGNGGCRSPKLASCRFPGSDIHSLVPDKPTANVATIDAQPAGAELYMYLRSAVD